MNIYDKLFEIQQKIDGNKNKRNDFGNFIFRSNEGTLEKLKPFLKDVNCIILQHDTINDVAGKVFVEATSSLVDCETGEKISCTASANHAESKKGMDNAQLTGACSSYARKYSLSGLLALSHSDDFDSFDNSTSFTNTGAQESSNDIF